MNVRTWLGKKAIDGSFWSVISTNDTIIRIAFMIASKAESPDQETLVAATVTIRTFKDFLIHLFVLSILWVHFKHADEWNEGTGTGSNEETDLGSEKLTFARFKMACRTFSSAQAHESLTDEKIQADFEFLDVNKSGTVEFSEVSHELCVFSDVFVCECRSWQLPFACFPSAPLCTPSYFFVLALGANRCAATVQSFLTKNSPSSSKFEKPLRWSAERTSTVPTKQKTKVCVSFGPFAWAARQMSRFSAPTDTREKLPIHF